MPGNRKMFGNTVYEKQSSSSESETADRSVLVACSNMPRNISAMTPRAVPPSLSVNLVSPSALLSPSVNWLRTRSEEHTSELQSLMRISYAVFCLKKKNTEHSNISIKVNDLRKVIIDHAI